MTTNLSLPKTLNLVASIQKAPCQPICLLIGSAGTLTYVVSPSTWTQLVLVLSSHFTPHVRSYEIMNPKWYVDKNFMNL